MIAAWIVAMTIGGAILFFFFWGGFFSPNESLKTFEKLIYMSGNKSAREKKR